MMAGIRFARRGPLVASAAAVALCAAAPAWAQDEPATTPTPSAGQGSADADEQNIIVTVQRREQTLNEVPQSVSVVGGDTLERQQATSFEDYAQLVPGLNITQENPGESRVILRGINTGSVGSTVSVYVDDTPFGSSGSLSNAGVLAGDFDTFDVARIEVLRGPQGTLYGANALGGTLKFVTAAPVIGEFIVRGQAGVEFVDDGGTGWSGNGVVNVPLGDMLAFRASGFYRRNAGYIDAVGRSGEDVNESDSYGGRASLLFQPTDTLQVRLLALAQNIRADSPSVFEADPVTFQPVNSTTGLVSDERTRFELIPEYNDIDYRLFAGTVSWGLGFADLVSNTSYSILDQEQLADISFTGTRPIANFFYRPTQPGTVGLAFENNIRTEKFTQEVRLASPDNETLEWLVGVYYTHETGKLFQRFLPFDIATEQLIPQALTLGGVTIPEFVIVTLDSSYEEIAGFASATWHVTPRFDITAGGRYSHNSQDSEQLILQLGSGGTILGDSSQGVFTWSVAPRFEINDRVSIYARAAKGYRPGGPNAVPPNAPPNFPAQFRADTLVSYELGVRGQTADGTLGIDAAVFHIDWDDILINTVVFDANGTPFGANGNGRRARSTGAEITATLRPMRGLNAILNLAYTDAKLRDDTTPDDNSLNLTGGLAGDPLPYIPKLAANLSVDYDWRVLGDARAYVGANLHVVDDEPAGFAATYRAVFGRRLTLDGYETVDLRAGVDFGRFNVNAYIRNLTNSRGLVNAGFPQAIPADIGGTGRQLATVSSIRPRTIGMTVGVEF